MELTGKLKDKMAQAKDKDEAKKIMENAGMKLTDDELDTVAGGMSYCVHTYHGNKAGHPQYGADYNQFEQKETQVAVYRALGGK